MRIFTSSIAGLALAALLAISGLPAQAGKPSKTCRPTPLRDGIADACDACDPANVGHACHTWCQGCCHKCDYWLCKGVYPLSGGYGAGGYVDPRDTVLYSAQGWGMPMAVPLAPVVHHQYNYGWGLPSSRLTTPGIYQNAWPAAFTSIGGNPAFRGAHPPMVYYPTDTTQLGYYGLRVPSWQPRPVPFN